jgi:hypothetical protein
MAFSELTAAADLASAAVASVVSRIIKIPLSIRTILMTQDCGDYGTPPAIGQMKFGESCERNQVR